MKYSYQWLKEHIIGPLPPAEEIKRLITIRSFEVEEMTTLADDTVFDMKEGYSLKKILYQYEIFVSMA
jgi:hypothetical protein